MTPAQIAVLKATILADSNLTAHVTAGETGYIANYMNQPSTFVVWATNVPVQNIYDAVTWANLTPSDAPDGTALYTNRSLVCQAKQINLQIMLQGQNSVSGAKTNVRAGLQDALTNLPSGTGGALVSGGWPNVKTALQRFATMGEKAFATGTGTAATPGVLVFEGNVGDYDVVQAILQ